MSCLTLWPVLSCLVWAWGNQGSWRERESKFFFPIFLHFFRARTCLVGTSSDRRGPPMKSSFLRVTGCMPQTHTHTHTHSHPHTPTHIPSHVNWAILTEGAWLSASAEPQESCQLRNPSASDARPMTTTPQRAWRTRTGTTHLALPPTYTTEHTQRGNPPAPSRCACWLAQSGRSGPMRLIDTTKRKKCLRHPCPPPPAPPAPSGDFFYFSLLLFLSSSRCYVRKGTR